MKKSIYSVSQIMDALKRVDLALMFPDVCRELGINTATFYKWRAKYGGMDVSLMSCMKELEEENRRLKKMYPEDKLKDEIVAVVNEKRCEAITQTGDSQQSGSRKRAIYPVCRLGVSHQRVLLSI